MIGETNGITHVTNAFSKFSICRDKGETLRSNRPLTEFSCVLLERFLSGRFHENCQFSQGNTVVLIEVDGRIDRLKVLLFGSKILEIMRHDKKVLCIDVLFTEFFDKKGRPSTTTCERLNGLLDRLGVYGVTPPGVRVFNSSEEGLMFLGKGDNKVAIGRDYLRCVKIKPSAVDLVILNGFLSE